MQAPSLIGELDSDDVEYAEMEDTCEKTHRKSLTTEWKQKGPFMGHASGEDASLDEPPARVSCIGPHPLLGTRRL